MVEINSAGGLIPFREYLEFLFGKTNQYLDKNLYIKSQKKINLDPYSDYKLIPNGSIKKSSKLLNLDPFNDEFHSDCKKVLPQHEIEKNKKWELQYGCISQEGRLVCGNRIK